MKPLCTVIIPTFNNAAMLQQCIGSFGLSCYGPARQLLEFIVVNNGDKENERYIPEGIRVLSPGCNLGWEAGLKLGLANTNAPFVLFSNDDIRLISGQKDWLWRMMATFNDPRIGAVGPASNFVMGPQNIFLDIVDRRLEVKYLIGFFMLLRREALDKAGGIDDTLPGGDDIDLSIRIRDAGYKLVCRRDVFVFHHGAVTGNRVHSGHWNSIDMTEATQMAIIKKHGMLKFWETMVMGSAAAIGYPPWEYGPQDTEGDCCRQYVNGRAVLELGCGGRKTHEAAVGVDLYPRDAEIPFVAQGADRSKADVLADVSTGLPVPDGSQDTIIARHILEHCQNTLGTLAVWNRALRHGGRLIVAVPNQEIGNTIMGNPEHVVSFVPESLDNMARCCGFEREALHTDVNGVSFVAVYRKAGSPVGFISDPRATVHAMAARLDATEAVSA